MEAADADWHHAARTTRYRVDDIGQAHYVVLVGAGLAVGLKREAGADTSSNSGAAPQR